MILLFYFRVSPTCLPLPACLPSCLPACLPACLPTHPPTRPPTHPPTRLVQGRDAGALLNYLSTADVDGDAGVITYTQWLNASGKLEADVTVSKQGADSFLVVVTDTMHRHVETWIRRHIGERFVTVADVTSSYVQLNLQGPNSRALLQKITDEDMGNEVHIKKFVDLHDRNRPWS